MNFDVCALPKVERVKVVCHTGKNQPQVRPQTGRALRVSTQP